MPRTDDGGLSSESPNLLPVYWLRSRGRLIRALSLLIRDDAGEVVGVLCINQDVTNVSAAAGQLQALLALLPPGEASILPEASASADALASEHAAAQLASAVSRNTEAKDLQKDSDIELEGSVLKTVYAMIDRMTERGRRRPFCPAKNGFLSFVSWIRAACFLLRARSTMPQSV